MKAEATDELIRRAAFDLFAQRGYHGTSMRDVARAVGVQMASLYYHFDSKQDLLVDLMRDTMHNLTKDVAEAMEAADDVADRLAAGVRAHVCFHAQHRAEVTVTDTELRVLDIDVRPQIIALRDQHSRLFRTVIEEGCEQGLFDVRDPSVMTNMLLTMANGVTQWFRSEGPLGIDDVADEMVALILDGIVVR